MDLASASMWIVECFGAVVAIYLLQTLLKTFKNLPPGPPSLPVIGCLHLIGKSPHQSFAHMAQKYGPLMSLRLGQKLCIVATSPETAMEFLKYQDANFNRRPPMRANKLIWPEDFVWNDITPSSQHAKKIIQVMLTSTKRVEESHQVRTDEISSMLRTIAKDGPTNVVLKHHLEVVMVNYISRMTFSKRSMGENMESHGDLAWANEFKQITEEIAQIFGAFNLRDFVPAFTWLPDLQGLERRMKKVRIRMESFLSKIIREHCDRDHHREKDMIDALLDAMDENQSQPKISNDMLKGVVWNVFTAGTETTVAMAEWILAEVCRNPSILQKAQAELDAVVGHTRLVQKSDIPKLNYIEAIVKEGLRLHPPVPLLLPHISIKACKAFGYDVPANTHLLVNVWAIGRDGNVWRDPLQFQPERFLDGSSEAGRDFQGRDFQLLPFGSGRRLCPGLGMGVVVVQSVVAALLQAFEWRVSEDIDMSEGVGLAIPMAVPFSAHAKARLPFHLYQ